MSGNHYDIIVLGMELGPMAAGALLAKRGFRVLVVGQAHAAERYPCFEYTFARRPFRFISADSPVVRRIVSELGISQVFSQIVRTTSPLYQVVLPGARLDAQLDPAGTEDEIRRELPEASSKARELLAQLGQIYGEIDKLIGHDLVIPPGAFLERRELARAEVQNPFRSASRGWWLLDRCEHQRLRDFFEAPVRFAAPGPSPLPPIPEHRVMGGWLFGCRDVEGGRDGLVQLFAEQIAAQGGELHPRQRALEIPVHKGRVVGVRIAGREEVVPCQAVLTDASPREISALVPPATWTKTFRALVDASPPPLLGYAVNLGVDREVIPAALASTVFVAGGAGTKDRVLRVELVPQHDESKAVLHVSCAVPPSEEESIRSGALRDAMLDRVRWLLPFLDNHLKVVHSPFDGFGALDLAGSACGDAPPVPRKDSIPRWKIRPPSADGVLGFGGAPHRTGIKGLLLAGSQVVCGLGAEGELLAAWGAARIAGKLDPGRERLVRSLRTKVEL